MLRNVYFGEVTDPDSHADVDVNNAPDLTVYGAKVITDLSIGYSVNSNFKVTLGTNNLLDVYPDRAEAAFGNRSSGRFDWSRRAQQFGIGGRYVFARLNFKL